MGIAGFENDDVEIIMTLARKLTGTRVNKTQHSVIIHNVMTRMMHLKCNNLENYLHLVDHCQSELPFLISALTIHTTSWFREPGAFERLEGLLREIGPSYNCEHPFNFLCIASSTGEEVYSFAMLLETYRIANPTFDFQIEGWDIDPVSLLVGRQGKYSVEALRQIPDKYHHFVVKSSASESRFTIPDSILKRCSFKTVNVLNPPKLENVYDFVSCRNMLIYFDPSDVDRIVKSIFLMLKPNKYFCTGVSETSAVNSGEFHSVGRAIFSKFEKSSLKCIKIPASGVGAGSKRDGAPGGVKRVLVVEDDADILNVLVENLLDENYEVYEAKNSEEAIGVAKIKEISLVLSDFRMGPGKNGIELCKVLRAKDYRGPFVIVSGFADREMSDAAIEAGCNEVVLKPFVGLEVVRLVRRYIGVQPPKNEMPNLLLFGASTGGTEVLVKMLSGLPPNCPPVVVVQHITTEIAQDFAERLAQYSRLKLGQMKHEETLQPGHIYVSLGDYHIGVRQVGPDLRLIVSNEPPMTNHRPSVDFLFTSAAKTKAKIFAALMTGMGKDGAQGLLRLKHIGAETFAQNEKTCVVYGMPREAALLNAAHHILSPEEIREHLNQRLTNPKAQKAS